MANYYPLNTPFINYYFYKAPFINDAYSLTNFAILSGGAGFAVNDVLILGGGTYTNPAVIQVTSVLSGVITGFIITNNGKYTITPTVLTMLSTNGSGTGATFGTVVSSPNLYPIGPNVPLAGGFIYFYEDENRIVQANTYSDVSDPQNPVVNPNPIQLGSSGDFPPIYMEDRFYYIVITDNTGDEANPVEVLEHYNPLETAANPSVYNDNFVVNPQFNYPIVFYKTTDDFGEITKAQTSVAWGWDFLEDEQTTSKNYVSFNNVVGQSIEGSPINEIVLTSSTVSGSETKKEFRTILGNVDLYSEENLTFSCQMMSKLSGNVSVKILLELNYGSSGSDSQLITLTTFTVSPSRAKFVYSFEVPSISGKTIDTGNYLAIRIQPGLDSICTVGITNVMVEPGVIASPIFNAEPVGLQKGEILGDATDISGAGLIENYSPYYYNNGKIFPYPDTGTMTICPLDSDQPFRDKCDGTTRLVNNYKNDNIPYRRLYDVIGNTFGGSGTLIADASSDTVTVTCTIGAVEKTAWADFNTGFTITKVLSALQYGWSAAITGTNQVTLTFTDNFAPVQTPVTVVTPPNLNNYTPPSGVFSYWTMGAPSLTPPPVTVTTTNPGSGAAKAVAQINFSRFDIPTNARDDIFISSSFLDSAIFTNNVRGFQGGDNVFHPNRYIVFDYDGIGEDHFIVPQVVSPRVNFLSKNTNQQNLKAFVNTVANSFVYTIKVNSVPLAAQYFLYSDPTTDFYLWFTVNGVGVDPAVAGRTGIVCPIFTGYSVDDVAAAVAEAMNDAVFALPSDADTGVVGDPTKVYWFINL